MIPGDFTTIQTWANGNVDGSNVDASLTGRRLVGQFSTVVASGSMTAGNFYLTPAGAVAASGAATGGSWLHLNPANFAVVGKSNTQLVVRMALATNSTAPAITIQGSLNAAAFVTGTANSLGITVGAVQGSAASFASPAATSVTAVEAGPFTFPAAGAYVPALNFSGSAAANSAIGVIWQLFVLNS